MRTYTELSQLETLEDRFDYLNLNGVVGDLTFGSNRWINQKFYRSSEWRRVRNFVIARDNGRELGVSDWSIKGHPHIHHMNPIDLDDIVNATENLLNPEYLISVSQRLHNAVHFGNKEQLPRPFADRFAGDTDPWVRTEL